MFGTLSCCTLPHCTHRAPPHVLEERVEVLEELAEVMEGRAEGLEELAEVLE